LTKCDQNASTYKKGSKEKEKEARHGNKRQGEARRVKEGEVMKSEENVSTEKKD
jgi:hypothetical protein